MSAKNSVSLPSDFAKKPVLSLILCSRNDQYMGNSTWRLQTTLNYVARNVHELGRESEVEVIVTDWGSEIPLRDALKLSALAARIVSFVHVPSDTARRLQKDSPFPEVLALNTAARRANGHYLGRIDQDTLVGKRFLRTFFEMYEDLRQIEVPLESGLLFANSRRVPYRFAVRCPSLWAVERFISLFGQFLRINHPHQRYPIYFSDVGIWLLHRNLWHECGGYDERLIYMNMMEIDMVSRLMERYKLVDLGKIVNYDFYHLEHYHPWGPRTSSLYRKMNPVKWTHNALEANNKDWGLVQYPLKVLSYSLTMSEGETAFLHEPVFILLLLLIGPQIALDKLVVSLKPVWRPLRSFQSIWRHRSSVAWQTVCGQPVISWPRLLATLWIEKKRSNTT
jgi:hypothetical protein